MFYNEVNYLFILRDTTTKNNKKNKELVMKSKTWYQDPKVHSASMRKDRCRRLKEEEQKEWKRTRKGKKISYFYFLY